MNINLPRLAAKGARAREDLSDVRMISSMRLLLASSSLFIIHVDPSQPDRFIAVTYITLILYTAYSAILFYYAARQTARYTGKPRTTRARLLRTVRSYAHWIDIGWYSVLIALSSGTNTLFFFGFFFAILVASFRWGFASGYKTVFVSAVIFTVVSYITTPSEPAFEWSRFLSRSTSILVLGYMIAHWGGSELLLKRKLGLLKEVNALSNPRFGVGKTIGDAMEKTRAFYDADTCLAVDAGVGNVEYHLRRASRDDAESATRVERIPEELADLLLGFEPAHAVIYCEKSPRWWRTSQKYFAGLDITTGVRIKEMPPVCERVVGTLDTQSFVSVPARHRGQIVGRFYLTAKHAFHISDHYCPVRSPIDSTG